MFRLLSWLVIIEVSASGFLARELSMLPDGRLYIAILDVGQGDAALITTPSGKQILIDTGMGNAVLTQLGKHMPFFDRSIDLLVLTHPQLDHMGAAPEILKRYAVGRVLLTGVAASLTEYHEVLSIIRRQRIPVWIADPKADIDLGDGVALDIVWPRPDLLGASVKELNDTSVVMRALLNGTPVALFTGDIEATAERNMLATGADVRADLLKVPHHGSTTSTSTGLLLAVQPSIAVVSAGRKNRYGHPHHAILDRLRAFTQAIKITAEEGTVALDYGSP